jgi:AraC-like DNA-binding protein
MGIPVKDKSKGAAGLSIAPFKSAIRYTDPHRHNGYFELIFLTGGSGIHMIDGHRYEVTPPVLFVIRKDQVHCWELSTSGEGYVLIIRKEFVDGLTDGRLRSLFASISVHNCLILEESLTAARLLEVLLTELKPDGASVPEVTEWTLKALLGKVIEVARPGLQKIREAEGLYERFLGLLSEGRSLKRTVSHYADLLHVTPQNLNNACRKAVDKPASDVLGDFLMTEAKRLLLYTDDTVAEISFALDFKDPSHFVKYFKRMEGQTPQSFRRS